MASNAHEERVMELFGRKIYSIPRNQRRYVRMVVIILDLR